MKIFVCIFFFVCFIIDATHITNFMTHHATKDFDDSDSKGPVLKNPWPSIFNSTYLYSIDMCFSVPGEHGVKSPHAFVVALGEQRSVSDVDNSLYHGYSTVPDGVTIRYCFISYACQWWTMRGGNRGNFDLEKEGNPFQQTIRYDSVNPDVPNGTPIEYLTRAATYKVETTEDIYLVDGYRVFDIHCSLDDCQITADTENGGSGTTHSRQRIQESVDKKKAATCLDDAPALEVREIYLITFTCDEVCPKKLKVTGTKKPTASQN